MGQRPEGDFTLVRQLLGALSLAKRADSVMFLLKPIKGKFCIRQRAPRINCRVEVNACGSVLLIFDNQRRPLLKGVVHQTPY